MSLGKRKNDLPRNELSEDEASASRTPSFPKSNLDDNESDCAQQLAEIRAQRDEARVELAASQAEIERLRSAALAPCSRCNFHPDWTVRVRAMGGQVYIIICPDGPATLIAHVKQELVQFDPKFHIQQQLTLVLPCEASSSSSSNDAIDLIDPAIADDRTLASCGVSSGDLLELLVVDIDWSNHSLEVIELVKHGGEDFFFVECPIRDDDGSLALSWALVNAVRCGVKFSVHLEYAYKY
jgi:hypothetical protein